VKAGLTLFLVFTSCVFSFLIAQSESIKKIAKDRYEWQSQHYTFNDLGDIFPSGSVSREMYDRYYSSKKVSMILGWSTLALAATGAGLIYVPEDKNCSSGGVCTHNLVGALIAISAIIPGTVAIVYKVRSNRAKTRSIEEFNKSILQEEVNLGLGFKGGGIRLTLNF